MKLIYAPLLLSIFITSCNGQGKKTDTGNPTTTTKTTPSIGNVILNNDADTTRQISQYIRRIFQDHAGNIWVGTNDDGVCRFNPTEVKTTGAKALTYFGPAQGLSGQAVRGIAEDKDGNIWLGTDGGISKYDGKHFTNFTTKDGLTSNDIWSLLIDKTGTIWAGTIDGVCRYNPGSKTFTAFAIPAAMEKDMSGGISSAKLVWDIIEDRKGNIWFATNGGGIYSYNGKSLTNFSKKDGIGDNFIERILEDSKGNLWLATRHAGMSMYNGKSFKNFTAKDGLCGNEVWRLYEDKAGNIWISTRGSVCRYNPSNGNNSFTAYGANEGLTNCCVQSIFQDNAGVFWFGSGAGLFRFNGQSFTHITKDGPWQ